MPARTARKNNRPETVAIELDLENQIRGLLYLSGDERKLLEKLVKVYKFKKPMKEVILGLFEKATFADTLQCGHVFKLVQANCIVANKHSLSTRMFGESMKELGFDRGSIEGKKLYRFIKLKDLKDVSRTTTEDSV